MSETPTLETPPEDADHPLPILLDALRGLRFGSVTVIVQDGAIVQVERVEKKRVTRTPKTSYKL